MKIGLLYEMQHPGDENGKTKEHELIWETLEQVKLADALGFHSVWFVEHHFLDTFALSSANETVLAALSQITKNIRLGFGVVILPYHNPVQVAEKVAMVDHLSKGRVEFGTGRGSAYEQLGMGVDPALAMEMWEESLYAIPRAWQTERFALDGRFWKVPERNVIPHPYQKPHPAIWNACLSPVSYQKSAECGVGVLAFAMTAPERVQRQIAEYRERIKDCKPAGAFVNNQWFDFVLGYCDRDNAYGRELGDQAIKSYFAPNRPYSSGSQDIYKQLLESWGYQVPEYLKAIFDGSYAASTDEPEVPPDLIGSGFNREKARSYAIWNQLSADELADKGVIIAGDPESCIKGLKMHEEAGADGVLVCMQVDKIPHEKVMSSLRLFGEKVLPAFHEGAPTRQTVRA